MWWKRNRLLHDELGVAFLEMLIAFVPMWVFSLCVFQLVLIARASLIVRHAADAAARSAAVVLPDDPNEYGGEPVLSVGRNRINGDDLARVLARVLSVLPASSGAPASLDASRIDAVGNPGRSRLNTIRLAAYVPLVPLAPVDVGADDSPSLRKALGGERALLSALYYQPFAVAVTFPEARGQLVDGPEVTVRVTYALQCSVPLARHLLCSSFDALSSEDDWSQSFAPLAQRFVGGTFRQIVHDSTLLLHRAPYEYRPRAS